MSQLRLRPNGARCSANTY